MNPPDQWATLWPQTLVTPVFVGGPADGKRDKPRPRHELPLEIRMPVLGEAAGWMTTELLEDVHEAVLPRLGIVTYRMGPYRDAFTVEYR